MSDPIDASTRSDSSDTGEGPAAGAPRQATEAAQAAPPLPPPLADEHRPQAPVPQMVRDRPGRPKLWSTLRRYSLAAFASDVTAGLTVGLVALPLAMAFAISSGMPPQAGLYTAIVTGLLISALGGSRVQIGGPTGAFVVVVAGIVTRYGVDGLFLCTMMAGVMLIVLGVTGMGAAVRFIPRPVVVGFTNGISVIIASTQIKDFFGLTMGQTPGELVPRLVAIAQSFHTMALAPTLLAVACLALLIVCLRRQTPIPGSIIALVCGTAAVMLFGLPVDTINSRFNGIPSSLPALQMPRFQLDLAWTLLPSAFTVAMLGAIESLMSAVVADRMSGDRHDPNVELVAQGIANVASPLVGGLPATGALARTATNVRSGARTPVAGMVHALTLLVIVFAAAPLAGQIPLPVLAALLLVVAWNMGEWAEIKDVLRMTRTDVSVWLVTFALTVFADLTIAVAAGMALAALLFIRTVASTTNIAQVTEEIVERERVDVLQDKALPPYVAVFRIKGPFLFGATDKLDGIAERLDSLPPIVILRLRYMTATDATGLRAIEDLARIVRASGRAFLVSGAQPQPAAAMARARFHEHLGAENVCATYDDALARAKALYLERFQPGFPHGAPPEPETGPLPPSRGPGAPHATPNGAPPSDRSAWHATPASRSPAR